MEIERCKKCPFVKEVVYALHSEGMKYLSCTHPSHNGAWVANIKHCPKETEE